MVKEFQRLSGDNPVRFVITTGDNVYGTVDLILRFNNTGDKDSHWETRFFRPYEPFIRAVFPSTRASGITMEMRPRIAATSPLISIISSFRRTCPSRYYRFSYGGLADFFALDSTANSEERTAAHRVSKRWTTSSSGCKQILRESRFPGRFRISTTRPLMQVRDIHQPQRTCSTSWMLLRAAESKSRFPATNTTFNSAKRMRRLAIFGMWYRAQAASYGPAMFGIRWIGLKIEGWAAVLHFLSVEIDGTEMRITPISPNGIEVVDNATVRRFHMPLRVTLD